MRFTTAIYKAQIREAVGFSSASKRRPAICSVMGVEKGRHLRGVAMYCACNLQLVRNPLKQYCTAKPNTAQLSSCSQRLFDVMVKRTMRKLRRALV